MEPAGKRPKLITSICVLGFIWIVFTFPGVFAPTVKKHSDWLPALMGLVIAGNFIAYIGLWHMKRWGVNMFIVTVVAKQILALILNDINFFGVGLSTLFLAVMLRFYKRMDVNL